MYNSLKSILFGLSLIGFPVVSWASGAALQCVEVFDQTRQWEPRTDPSGLRTGIASSLSHFETISAIRPRANFQSWLSSLGRDPLNGVGDPIYVRNITRSTFTTFRTWFESGMPSALTSMLSSLHLEVVKGNSEDPLQWYIPEDLNVPSVDRVLQPGTMRSSPNFERVPELEYLGITNSLAKKLTQLSREERVSLPRRLRGSRTKIEGIPAAAQPEFLGFKEDGEYSPTRRVVIEPTVYISYAKAEHIHLYLSEMDRVLRIVHGLIRGNDFQGRDQKVVRLLARYHQLFIAALPFARVNNSIAMAQINYILLTLGLNPIAHSYLDVICLLVSSDRYQDLFETEVFRSQKM